MTEIKHVKLPLHRNSSSAKVYDADGKYLFWITLAGESNALENVREKSESWLDFRNRTQPMRDAMDAEELQIADLFVEAVNSFDANTAALAAKDAEIERLRKSMTAARASIRNARGAVESNQVVDKDVHGTLSRAIRMIDAALNQGASDA